MHTQDIFYSILQDTHFFSSFFYQQFLIDLQHQRVHDIKNKTNQSTTDFFNKHPLSSYIHKKQEIIYTPFCLILKPQNYKEYILVLYWNKELSFFKEKPHFLPSLQQQILSDTHTIESLLYKNPTYPIYIAFFDFYSNQDMTNPEVLQYMYNIITTIFKNRHIYYCQYQYNKYYLILKDMTEIEVFTSCIAMYQEFSNNKKIYLIPHFFITEYTQDIPFDTLIHKIYLHFIQLPDHEEILTKQDIATIIKHST